MSLDIWTLCAGPTKVGPLSAEAWRVVEAQHLNSTHKLVDSLSEQNILENLIDQQVKPPRPRGAEFEGLHYLLWTPFRYSPSGRGSRFGLPTDHGMWYGSTDVQTALAEKAFHHLVFLNASAADFSHQEIEWSSFTALVKTERGVDLTSPPFAQYAEAITDPASYKFSLPLGTMMRKAEVEAVLFASARSFRGKNVGLFAPAFANKNVSDNHPRWTCFARKDRIEVRRKNLTPRPKAFVFTRAGFEIDGRLISPAFEA